MMNRSSISRKNMESSSNDFEVQNIFEMESYVAKQKRPLFSKSTHRQHISHYRNRLKLNYRESKIHSLMGYK